MARAIVLREYGGPEQLALGDIEIGDPGPGEVLIRHTGIGVNYIDTYYRRGIYPIPLPAVIGDQASGVIEALGAELELCATRFFDALEQGVVRPHPVERFALADAAQAHLHLEDRAKASIPILVP